MITKLKSNIAIFSQEFSCRSELPFLDRPVGPTGEFMNWPARPGFLWTGRQLDRPFFGYVVTYFEGTSNAVTLKTHQEVIKWNKWLTTMNIAFLI